MSQIHDLRSFISVLEKAGQLTRIARPVSLVHELANVAATVQRQGRGAALFTQPKEAAWPIFAGGVGSSTLAALALECDVAQITPTMEHALDPAAGISPRRVETAVWQENILTGDDIDLHRLPIPTHGLHDGGPFITGGITIAKDPVSGRGNLSYNRMQVLGPRTFGFNVNEWRHVMQFYKVQEAKGEPLEIAIAIGVDPAISIAAGVRYDDDELRIAGAIRGEGMPVCKGVTVDLDIPANAEIVIEGYLPPRERHAEGPLAEFHGYYGELWQSPVLEVTAVSHRTAPIFQTIIPGHDEHIYIGNVLPREPLLLRFVRHVSQNVTGLHIPPYGNGFAAIVQVAKSNPGEPKNVALAAFTAHVNIKKVIVVDPDVNIYDPADVLWALTNRVDWSRDFFTVPGAQGHEMDPTANERGVHTKIGIDATYKPDRRDYGERIRYPEVDLSKYLQEI
ncbi:MAG: UbiD family decarboxylase [Ardenticatenaceae bacterium]|nr:UbiD family decarboxylase [Anaerolineales bacterium]MCB8921609.1 UbiD family decarboxylase [Ardenticatenaceae bacterium]